MAFIQCGFHSDVLGRACAMNVILPQKVKTQIGMTSSGSGRKDYPVVYLLHGLSDDHTIWSRRSSIERYAAEYEVAVVMPNGERGFYTDMIEGYRYWTMLSEELPEIVCNLFPVSPRREDTFAAGLSMGGGGTAVYALRHPELFGSACSMSGLLDMFPGRRSYDNAFQQSVADNSPVALLRGMTAEQLDGVRSVRWWVDCGDDDFLWKCNVDFYTLMRERDIPLQYRMRDGGHTWRYWQTVLPDALTFVSNGFGK